MRKMYTNPTTEVLEVKAQTAILSASGEKKQEVITPKEMWMGALG